MIELLKVVRKYNQQLEDREVKVNGYSIPEIYFRRIFNEDLASGGRYYDHGEILSKSKKERETVFIDGEETVSLDFKHLHPSICYNLKGINLNGKDPYDVEVLCDIDTVKQNAWMIKHHIEVVPDVKRNLAKTGLLCMINARDKVKAMGAVSKELAKDKNKVDQSNRKFVGVSNVKVKDMMEKLYCHNEQIKEHFYSGCGVLLQNLDSNMISKVIETFLDEDEVLIPVHDAVICRKGLQDFGIKVMLCAYEDVLGSSLNGRVEVE